MEQWKDIPGYEGIYQASNTGQIRSVEGKETWTELRGTRIWKQRILKQKFQHRKKTDKMDARVALWKDGKCKDYLVARLVAMTWCNGYTDGATVNHIDGNPMNNCADNLEWVSLAKNIRLGFETGLFPTQKRCTLVDEKGTRHSFRSQCEASRSIGRSPGYIANCLMHKRQILSASGERYGAS